jgi:hypothetical protein
VDLSLPCVTATSALGCAMAPCWSSRLPDSPPMGEPLGMSVLDCTLSDRQKRDSEPKALDVEVHMGRELRGY